jgi:D-alanine-D-alanine ligase
MKVGFTYDLRADYLALGFSEEETAEFDSKVTIDAIAGALEGMGFEVSRVGHVRNLVSRLAAGERFDLVFNIAEGLHGYAREAQVPALLDAYDIPYTFSDPLVLSLCLHKAMCKHVVRDCGIATPDFAVVEDAAQARGLSLPFPVFAKPVAEGTSKGVSAASKAENPKELERSCARLLKEFSQPVLVEAYLPGREFTVGLAGTGSRTKVLGVMEVLLLAEAEQEAYSYHNKEHYENLVRYRLADDAKARASAELAVAAWKALNCRDGGRVDVKLDACGKPGFIEVNPLPGLNPERSDLPILCGLAGLAYRDLLEMIVQSALERRPARLP